MKLEEVKKSPVHVVYIYINKDCNFTSLKLLDEDLMYYAGLSDSNLKNRICDHASSSNFKKYLDKSKIYVCPLSNSTETAAVEKLIINAFKPILNTKDKLKGLSITKDLLPDLDWYPYERYILYLPNKPIKEKTSSGDRKSILSWGGYIKYPEIIDDISLLYRFFDYFCKLAVYRMVLNKKYNYKTRNIADRYIVEIDSFIVLLLSNDHIFPNKIDIASIEEEIENNGININEKTCRMKLPPVKEYQEIDNTRESFIDVCLRIIIEQISPIIGFDEYWTLFHMSVLKLAEYHEIRNNNG